MDYIKAPLKELIQKQIKHEELILKNKNSTFII